MVSIENERVEPHIGSLKCGKKPLMPSRLLYAASYVLLDPPPRHVGGSITRHEHQTKRRLSNSSEPPYFIPTYIGTKWRRL
ncbi:hypothetical protein KY285_037175 [Solanum tuberosum]|nr:hypothetical protein KY284_037178 [Solanum tuberosum]KAH0637440.1 hypothetical protein KY289_037355 [Solanum tuberosum]KAH0640589.1 hypothetical protein KY285_037175 [Solanum tuberosum]